MTRTHRGFTLLELMVVVAIIGIVASIAVPSFLRYQLRARFAELRTNVNAIHKGQEALRQSERMACTSAATGQYVAFGSIPASATPGSTRILWSAADYAAAGAIGWSVEGGTYAVYAGVTGAPPTPPLGVVVDCSGTANSTLGLLGGTVTVTANSDLDGDGTLSAVTYWKPIRSSAGVVAAAAPAAPNLGGSDLANCAGGTQPATSGDGQVTVCSSDNVL